VKAATP